MTDKQEVLLLPGLRKPVILLDSFFATFSYCRLQFATNHGEQNVNEVDTSNAYLSFQNTNDSNYTYQPLCIHSLVL